MADHNYTFQALADVTLSNSGLQQKFSAHKTDGDGLSSWLVIAWELPGLLAKRSVSKESLTGTDRAVQAPNVWDTVVISGSASVYEASTAEQYLTKHFTTMAKPVMDIVQDALDHIGHVRGKLFVKREAIESF